MSSLSDPFLPHCCCCFVCQKLHLNIKTQKHYCNNHSRTVFSPLPEKYRYPSILILYLREELTFCIFKEYLRMQILKYGANEAIFKCDMFDNSIFYFVYNILHTVYVCLKWKRGLYDLYDL